MARKTLADIDPGLTVVIEEFQAVGRVKDEMAKDAIKMQDKETRAAIDRILGTLQTYATGYITPKIGKSVVPVKVDNEFITMHLRWLAVEIAKDLAFVDIRLANFTFPPSLCASCGADIIPEKRTERRASRG